MITKKSGRIVSGARKLGWLSDDRNAEIAAEYYRWCRHRNKACITIRPGRKFAQVSLFMHTTDDYLTNRATNLLPNLFKEFATSKSECFYNDEYAFLKRIELDRAPALATHLVMLANEPSNREPVRTKGPFNSN